LLARLPYFLLAIYKGILGSDFESDADRLRYLRR
jgi:hypothetical protein